MIRLRVKEVAEAHGLNMSQLSRRSDVSFSTVKRLWRNPHRSASTEILEKLAAAIGVSIHDLIEELPDP
ncbi:hypothetical protein KSF_087570 [Reticulibacter mediterranei]|uniref:XRE family transcriptional regulator n=1 Tax=Reticulibacter mediterranei TaxID=2778369 RepID=A0A8J3N547_9CHLR|nr:helix-turn-helix transcriptional regulator [Reticulibacter mediterranei]GHO98709.1 hypothetical protein KSF_087570 [Reticulibacter mediterranei]